MKGVGIALCLFCAGMALAAAVFCGIAIERGLMLPAGGLLFIAVASAREARGVYTDLREHWDDLDKDPFDPWNL